MTNDLPHLKQNELYSEHLKVLNGINFTIREVDVIACVLNNRGEKKIASILEISPKTVSSHVHNIMMKLNYNSREQIIDFAEKSGKIKLFRDYYIQLLVNANFEKKLGKIATQVIKKAITCYYNKEENAELNDHFFQSINRHLKLANIELIGVSSQELQDKISRNTELPVLEPLNITGSNYYCDFLTVLSVTLNSREITEITKEFIDEYNSITQLSSKELEFGKNTENINIPFYHRKNIIKVIIPILIIIIVCGILINLGKNGIKQEPEIVINLERFLKLIQNNGITANNIDQTQAQNNQSIIKNVEKLLEYRNTQEVQKYLDKAEMHSDILVNYLYNLLALSAYYLYNHHDGVKAQEILLYAKELGENYVNNRNSIKADFKKLAESEIYSELSIVKDLPQIYTRIIYLLGRTYIYNNKSVEGKRYFALAKYLSSKLNLYEHYLSDISGLLLIEKDLANLYLQQSKTEQAKRLLQDIIAEFNHLKNNDDTYIIEFKPGLAKQNTVIPSSRIADLFHCHLNIIELYGILISITNDQQEKMAYIAKIISTLDGTNHSKGLLAIMDQVPSKKIASLCNTLGKILLMLGKSGIDNSKLIQTISDGILQLPENNDKSLNSSAQILQTSSQNNLTLAEQLFEKAKSISRNNDFTKADAYDGLVTVYQHKLIEAKADNHQQRELQAKIQEFMSKRDAINNELHRKN